MTLQIYRDVACADGCALVAEVSYKLIANGWSYVAHSTGSGGSRSASQPANATELASALRTGHSSWICLSRGTRKISLQRATTANPDYTSWRYEYTASGTLSTGTATSPDRNSTDSQYVSNNNFRILAPSTTGVADAMKVHIVVDDSGPSFVAIARRTPLPAGNVGFFSAVGLDLCTNLVWTANPDPIVGLYPAANTNTGNTELLGTSYNHSWLGYGLPGAAWTGIGLENPGSVAGSTITDKSAVDVLFQARWAFGSGVGVLGTSTLFRLLQPGRTPVVGIDAGATLNWAAFWSVVVPNDGTALSS